MPVFKQTSAWNNCRAMGSLALHVLTGRWMMVFASLLIMSVGGSTYLFGLYSGDIKSALGYDQTTLNLISFFKDLGCNVGIISGLINEVTPPWAVLLIGASMNFFGYFMIWLAVAGRIAKPHVWQICLYICIGANSQAFTDTAALVACVVNFPQSRGMVLGLLKGFVGLSGAIISQLYHAFYGHDTKSLILFIAWLPAAVNCIFLRTIRYMKVVRQANELKIIYYFLFISLGLAGFLMMIIIVQNKVEFNTAEYAASATVLLILLFAPLIFVFREEFSLWKIKNQILHDHSPVEVVAEIPQPEKSMIHIADQTTISTPWWSDVFNPPARGEDYTILQAVCSIDMLIIFISGTIGIGGTLTAIDNLGQIGKSLGYPASGITTFVSLVSIWNYLGRVVAGFGSEILLTKYKLPRPFIATVALFLSCIGYILIAFGVPNSLYVASILMGFCFGAQWILIFAIISELFGLKYYSTLYNFGSAASPIGAYILNVAVAGKLYDKEALKQMTAKGLTRKAGEDLSCVGVECYKKSFIIITVATFIGCVISFILVLRTREFYKSDIYKKFREQDEAAAVTEATSKPANEPPQTLPEADKHHR